MKGNVLFIMALITYSRGQQRNIEMKTWYQKTALDNHVSTLYMLSEHYSSSKDHCGLSCTLSEGCASFFYTEPTGSCQLHNRIFELQLPLPASSSVVGAGYYVDKCSHRHFKKLGETSKYVRVEFTHTQTYEAAESMCKSFGGTPLRIYTVQESHDVNIFMRRTFLSNPALYQSGAYWLAAKRDVNAKFLWPDGEEVISSVWMPGQPEHVGYKACVLYVLDQGLGNIECDYQQMEHRLFPLCQCES